MPGDCGALVLVAGWWYLSICFDHHNGGEGRNVLSLLFILRLKQFRKKSIVTSSFGHKTNDDCKWLRWWCWQWWTLFCTSSLIRCSSRAAELKDNNAAIPWFAAVLGTKRGRMHLIKRRVRLLLLLLLVLLVRLLCHHQTMKPKWLRQKDSQSKEAL